MFDRCCLYIGMRQGYRVKYIYDITVGKHKQSSITVYRKL